MKTNKQNKTNIKNSSELKNRTEQLSETKTVSPETAANSQTPIPEPEQSKIENQKSKINSRPYVNFQQREQNRALTTEKVLDLLKRWMPRQYELAEVVGKWIWITFPEQPVEQVRADLSQLGFHWNNTRKCWQHPCGETLPRGTQEPREKYPTYMAGAARTPADQIAA